MRREPMHHSRPREARMPQDLQTIRKKNLRELIRQWDGPTHLADKLGFAGPSYLSQLIGHGKAITEKTARKFETALGLPAMWMDTDHTALSAAAGRVDSGAVDRLMLSVISAVDAADLHLAPRCMANLVAFAYECAIEPHQVDESFVRKLVALMKCAASAK